ncbi:transcription factor IIA, alpha/beta subunit [Rhizodiscina lignyota]|uniref:Transcription factor IIA, alpha/beta subunit n=1 Tax=Rhizodiscina lignyota TaxID=1504668 RepID=A0A9P4IKB5_9PEZI|nr:transcription factor IIA, alpha/beta subunit [Rhizodiscina lignyota]
MSNSVVGNIYAQIIDKVIQQSQNDFEESGIDQATLAELKEAWQKRLTSYHVAQFPWDPAPVQTSAPNPPTLPSNVQKQEDSPPTAGASHPSGQTASNGVRIKTEPGYENGAQGYNSGMNGYPTVQGSTFAQQRAASLLQQQYGSQPGPPMPQGGAQPQPGFALPGQPRSTGIQLPGQQQQRVPQQQPYPPQQQPPQQQRNSLSAAQTDGAGDGAAEWSVNIAQGRGRSEADRIAADGQIKAHIERMAFNTDSGLMVPLSELPKATKVRGLKRKAALGAPPSSSNPAEPSTLPTIAQMDGGDEEDEDDEKPRFDEDEVDEDAINSDLDDSEDENNQVVEDDEGAAVSEAILCTYDKVQRVKNKWKCTLKDGVLSTKGKDYVFHKAQGEFEW